MKKKVIIIFYVDIFLITKKKKNLIYLKQLMSSNGIILTLAYPETIVMVSKEWFSPFLRFLGIGKKNYLKAVDIDQDLLDAKLNLAILYLKIKNLNRSEFFFNQILDKTKNFLVFYNFS